MYFPTFNPNDIFRRNATSAAEQYGLGAGASTDNLGVASGLPASWMANYGGRTLGGAGTTGGTSWDFDYGNSDWGDTSRTNYLRVKTGDKEGSIVPYQFSGGQWTPNQAGIRTEQWDTNDSEMNRNLALMAAAIGGGAYLNGGFGIPGAETALPGAAGSVAQASPIAMPGAAVTNPLPALGGAAGVGGAAAGGAGGAAATGGAMSGLGGAASWLGQNANWLAPLAGGLLGGMGGGPQTTTTSQNLPPWLDALSQQQAGAARGVFGMQNPGVEPFNPDQQAGFGAVRNRAMNNPLQGPSDQLAAGTLRGDFLNNNPFIDSIVNQTMDDLQGRFNTTAMGSGSFGNANVTQQGMRGMADAANTLRFNNYNAERGRQQQTLGMVPGLNQGSYTDANNLLAIGGQQQDFGNLMRQNPYNWLTQQLQAANIPITAYRGGTTTMTQPGNRASGALGGLLAGSQMWNIFNQPPPPSRA